MPGEQFELFVLIEVFDLLIVFLLVADKFILVGLNQGRHYAAGIKRIVDFRIVFGFSCASFSGWHEKVLPDFRLIDQRAVASPLLFLGLDLN